MNKYSRYLAEFIGTFFLVFFGTLSVVVNQETKGVIGNTGIALTFGLVVMILIYALNSESGAHFNPCVSLAFFLQKQLNVNSFLNYCLCQLLGAMAGSLVVKFLFPYNSHLGVTLPFGSWMQSFVLETILSFFLVWVIFMLIKKEERKIIGVVVGALICLEALFAGPISGASMNPARSLAPAIISGNFESIEIYLIAPFFGSCLAIIFYKFFNNK